MKLLSPKGVLILAASATGVGVAAARDPAFDMKNDMSPGRFESDATGGKLFTMNAVRAYEGKMIDFDTVENPPLPQLDGARICERWAVLTSIFEPTEAVHQLAELGDWCVVVVGDKKGSEEYDVAGVTFLTPADQEALPYRIAAQLPWNHFGRKNIGYLYAIHHGAKVIYDVDDDNALLRPAEGVPHANAYLAGDDVTRFHGDPSSGVHNPYGCFGAPGVVWPRGFPLTKIQDPKSSTCGVGESGPTGAPSIGVVQALANHDPDVDAIYRLTYPPGGLPFYFDPASPATAASPLRAVPASTFTPYNAQSAEEDYFDFDSLIEDAEQYIDQENADLIREYEQHVRDIELSFSSLVSWFYDFSDLEVGDENKENIGLLANRHV